MSEVLALGRRAREQESPLNAHLELTYRCTCNCAFCYNPRREDRSPLSAAEWADVFDDLRALGTLVVTLTGGEPLLHPEFLNVADAARRRHLALRIFTNGHLVDERMADAIASLLPLTVELSVHGASERTHEATTATAGSHVRLLEAIQLLRARRVRLVLKTPLTRTNEEEVDEIVALAGRLGVPLSIDPVLTPRDGGDLSPLELRASPQATERILARAAEARRLDRTPETDDGEGCGVGLTTLAIDPEGNVYPCLQWRRSSLGNVRAARLVDLWRGSKVRREAVDAARRSAGRFCPALGRYPDTATRPDPPGGLPCS